MSNLKALLAAKLAAAKSDSAFSAPVAELSKSEEVIRQPTSEEVQAAKLAAVPRIKFPDTPDNPEASKLRMEFAELQEALIGNLPDFPVILKQVHEHLRKDASLVTLMSEDEIKLVVQGVFKKTEIEVVAPSKVKGARSASKNVMSAEDL